MIRETELAIVVYTLNAFTTPGCPINTTSILIFSSDLFLPQHITACMLTLSFVFLLISDYIHHNKIKEAIIC